jgi:CheY-like chemotaxis protein
MASLPTVIALKQAGTTPPAEGVLSKFARVQAIRSPRDAGRVVRQGPDLVLIDSRMPALKLRDLVQKIREKSPKTVVMLLDFKQPPGALRQQLNQLATLVAPHRGKPLRIPRMTRILNTSQEGLSRILNVSTKTAHRWMNGTRPRPKPELTRLSQLMSQLLDSLPSEEAARDYLNHPNPSFNGETPVNLLTRGEFDRIEADLQALKEGVYL